MQPLKGNWHKHWTGSQCGREIGGLFLLNSSHPLWSSYIADNSMSPMEFVILVCTTSPLLASGPSQPSPLYPNQHTY